mmetsp:Transcript_33165/g.67368  ORF Transcript_33165/g.67368 Transcript_33165/m.67368 type:complete len:80 (+) Transcript_33165:247-486(+)
MRELEQLRLRMCKFGATGMFTGSECDHHRVDASFAMTLSALFPHRYTSRTLSRYTTQDHEVEVRENCEKLRDEPKTPAE